AGRVWRPPAQALAPPPPAWSNRMPVKRRPSAYTPFTAAPCHEGVQLACASSHSGDAASIFAIAAEVTCCVAKQAATDPMLTPAGGGALFSVPGSLINASARRMAPGHNGQSE